MMVTMKSSVFWDVMPCSLETPQHSGGAYGLCVEEQTKPEARRTGLMLQHVAPE
jgi:hypothetical protein